MSGKVKRGKKGRKPIPKPQHVPAPRFESDLSQEEANAILRAVQTPAPISAKEALDIVSYLTMKATRKKR